MKADPRHADLAERSRVARSAGLPLAAGNATPLSRIKKAYRTIKCYRNDMHNLCGLDVASNYVKQLYLIWKLIN